MNVLYDRKVEYIKVPDRQVGFFSEKEKNQIIKTVKE
jgi:hypothetical protein